MARSDSAGSITLWIARASSSSSSLSFSRACSSSGGAAVFFVCPEGALHRRGKFGGRQESSRAAAIQGENGRRCFLPHVAVRSACRPRRAGPHFFHPLTFRRPRLL